MVIIGKNSDHSQINIQMGDHILTRLPKKNTVLRAQFASIGMNDPGYSQVWQNTS
jgi:hypothetical protein